MFLLYGVHKEKEGILGYIQVLFGKYSVFALIDNCFQAQRLGKSLLITEKDFQIRT